MKYDVAIIGGGLAGLALAIDLRKRNYTVLVIEKGEYPRHKVCGEYISMESHRYLSDLCPALKKIELPFINKFKLTSGKTKSFKTSLDLGGFGISRHLLEDLLYKEALALGVTFFLNTKATSVQYQNSTFKICSTSEDITASLVCNATGRKSNLRTSKEIQKPIKTNYVGIKYHVRLPRQANLIEIHNFLGGYCGISNIEANKSCLCYIVNAEKLKAAGNSIPELERLFLFQNSALENIFKTADFIIKEPVTVSGINFRIKSPIDNHIFYLGDSAGSMAPVTGNGMSMALRSASYLGKNVHAYFSGKLDKTTLEIGYQSFWDKEYANRIKLSRYLQKLSEYPFLSNRTIDLFHLFPFLAKGVIRQTHGAPF